MTFDEILVLIDRLNESSLSEIKISDGDQTVLLRRGTGGAPTVGDGPVGVVGAAGTVGAVGPVDSGGSEPSRPGARGARGARGATATSASTSDAATSEGREQITSPIVGTFYRAPAPDSPPFTEEGDEVKSGQALCIIEAMKVMNELEAEFDLRVERVLVENGEMVEYGTALLEVTRL